MVCADYYAARYSTTAASDMGRRVTETYTKCHRLEYAGGTDRIKVQSL